MWPFSMQSLTQFLLSGVKKKFSWLLSLLLGCSCISVDYSFFSPSGDEVLFSLMTGLLVFYFTPSYIVFYMICFNLNLLLSMYLPCPLFLNVPGTVFNYLWVISFAQTHGLSYTVVKVFLYLLA